MVDKVVEIAENELEKVTGGVNKEQIIEIIGEVNQVLDNGQYIVLYSNRCITCHISANMRQNKIIVSAGDEVVVQLSPYDVTRGRIVSKNK